jgi:5'-methylthioadenosine phosphorylase
MPDRALIAIIGGSGLYDLQGLKNVRQVRPETPYGPPSDAITLGELEGVPIAFLPRHGAGHSISPSELPARANVYALKTLGVERVVSVSAVGSLQERIHPQDLVLPDQIIDRTRGRPSTFFEGGIVAHVAFAEPFCPELRSLLHQGAQAVGARSHLGGTMVVMDGPQFSTRAESNLYRSWGASVIGMTALPEAKLAREAEICYATLACATDYDCWHENEEPVSVEMIVQNLLRNVAVSKELLRRVIHQVPEKRACACASALKDAIITAPGAIPPEVKRRLAPIIGRYVK